MEIAYWREDVGGRKYLVEVLELLACLQTVWVWDSRAVDLSYIWESVDYKCTDKDGIGDLIILNTQAI